MPTVSIQGAMLDVSRNVALLDTNVLVALGNDKDSNHEQATLFMEAGPDYELLVAPPVVLETIAVLTRRRGRDVALTLVRWLLTPGNVTLFPSCHSPNDVQDTLLKHENWMRRFEIDFVDTYLMDVASLISLQCKLDPSAPIVTFDTGDFAKCMVGSLIFSIYDMRELQLMPRSP